MTQDTWITCYSALNWERLQIARYEIKLIEKEKLDEFEKEYIEINHTQQRKNKKAMKELNTITTTGK